MRISTLRAACVAAPLLGASACVPSPRSGVTAPAARVQQSQFGSIDGTPVQRFVLTNAHGVRMSVIEYGAAIASLSVPDRDGRFADVVLGYDSLPPYLADSKRLGAVVGRFANRIGHARFTLDGVTYELAKNNGPHNLHSGPRGFYKMLWHGTPSESADRSSVALTYVSPDGEMGFPGTVQVGVTYTLTDADELIVDYRATTDRATPINLTQHSYFNLTGDPRRNVSGHVVTVDADRFTPIDSTQLVTGEVRSVDGTPLDFRTPTALGARIESTDDQLRWGRGYDHNYVLRRSGPGLAHAARVEDPTSGRTIDVYTTEPGMQLYTANALDGTIHGKGGVVYGRRSAVCLETQHFPDSPNQAGFPSTILRPGEPFESRTIFRFGLSGR